MSIKIYIDQGHNRGTINAGAQGNGVLEADVNYQVGIYLAQLLAENSNFEVKVSRLFIDSVVGYDTKSSLQTRVDEANDWHADYFISIHTNANENPSIQGSEVYVYKELSQSYYLGEDVLEGIVMLVGTKNNQVRINPTLYVLRKTMMPSILVELAYLTNPSDAQKLLNDQYIFAQGMYQGILWYFDL
ncbi:MAG: N-acetylmuramoyl-L-alanine amidase [Longicatena sp.]